MTKEQIEKHVLAGEKLLQVKDEVFQLISKNIGKISEYEVNKFILKRFKQENLVSDEVHAIQIVAAGANTSFMHYFPKKKGSKIIQKENLIMLDIWAKLNEKDAPFADITWMAYAGKNISPEIEKAFGLVIGARKEAIRFLNKNLSKKQLPKSREIEMVARNYFKKFKVEKYFIHSVGHSLGAARVHGSYFVFSKKTKSKIKLNIPFTIEPGLYYKNKFGVRSEMNCYINENYKLVATTQQQKEIIKL